MSAGAGAEADGANGAVPAATTITVCWSKLCKKVPKPEPEDSAMCSCDNEGCTQHMHMACLAAMLAAFGASADFYKHVCSKRCYNAIMKQARMTQAAAQTVKRRVAWHNDGPSTSVSSLSCLLDWMTSGNNYSRYRGGDSHSGGTKMTIAGEVVRAIADSGITTPRNAKDVMTKINALEQSNKSAVDWLSATGQGVTDESSLRDAIAKRYAHYDVLNPIMADRASTRPLLLNTDEDFVISDDESDAQDHDDFSKASSDDTETDTDGSKKRPSSTPHSIATPKKSKKKRIISDADDMAAFVEIKEAQLAQERDFHRINVKFQQQQADIQQEELSIRKQKVEDEAREANARIEEATARALKLRQEAEHWRLQQKITLLRERKQLRDDGVPQQEIDLLSPLTTRF